MSDFLYRLTSTLFLICICLLFVFVLYTLVSDVGTMILDRVMEYIGVLP